MKKRLFFLLLACFLLTAQALASPLESSENQHENPQNQQESQENGPEESRVWPENPFTDVPDWEWYTPLVKEVVEKGLMTGTDLNLFGPNDSVTRAMVVVVLWKLEGSPTPQNSDSFPDVSPDDPVTAWYAISAAWAKEQKVARGHDDGCFRGEDPVTREELAAFLYSYDLYQGTPAAEGFLGMFSDAASVSDWAQVPIRHAVGMGYFRGDENGLRPQDTVIRAELAAILLRLLTPAVG